MARINKTGSALLIAVVLTSLLSMMGVMFLVLARVNSQTGSAYSQTRYFDSALTAVISKISHELVMDTPGVAGAEYYDYPGDGDKWLSPIEPNLDIMEWSQVSDIIGHFDNTLRKDVPLEIVKAYPEIEFDENDYMSTSLADAMGDGISDSRWIEVPNIRTGKGEPIYAAIKIIDNGGLININTAYAFDPNSYEHYRLDGTRQYQINLAGLDPNQVGDESSEFIQGIIQARENDTTILEPTGFSDRGAYFKYYVRSFDPNNYATRYTPFDFSDEMELRYRHLLNSRATTRLEDKSGLNIINNSKHIPYGESQGLADFYKHVANDGELRHKYWRRLLTTHNADRLIAPDGRPQYNLRKTVGDYPEFNIREMDNDQLQEFYEFLCEEIIEEADISAADKATLEDELAQIVVNLKDYMDNTTSEPSMVTSRNVSGQEFYGFKRPLIYISEVVTRYHYEPDLADPTNLDAGTNHFSMAIEVAQRYRNSQEDWDFRLNIFRGEADPNDPNQINVAENLESIPIEADDFNKSGGSYFVYLFDNPDALIDDIKYSDSPFDGAKGVVPDHVTLTWSRHYRMPSTHVFNMYLGTDRDRVADANELAPDNMRIHRENRTSFTPSTDGYPLSHGLEYFWRVDIVDPDAGPDDIAMKGPVWSFTTADSDPNTSGKLIDPSSWVFGEDTMIRLERRVGDDPPDWIEVDQIDYLPEWLFYDAADLADPNLVFDPNVPPIDSIRSFKRELRSNYTLKGFWDWGGVRNNRHSLGNSGEHYGIADGPPMQDYPRQFRNVGDIGNVFKVDAYSIPQNYDIYDEELEKEVRLDLRNPHVQKIFNYLTNWLPLNSEPDELRMKGRININTAPRFVIEQLPWISKRESLPEGQDNTMTNRHALSEAIVAYRDMLHITTDGVDINYTDRFDEISTLLDLDRQDIREEPGFESIGELNFVINDNNDDKHKEYNIAYYGLTGFDQIGPPDLTYTGWIGSDGVVDDFKERDLIFARISDLVTVRSDVFTAYILLRLGPNGPQRRYMALLDRSNVRSANDKVQVLYLQPVSPHWSKD